MFWNEMDVMVLMMKNLCGWGDLGMKRHAHKFLIPQNLLSLRFPHLPSVTGYKIILWANQTT